MMFNVKFVLIIGAFLSFSCFASNNDLVEDANRLCSKISLEGFSKELKFKGLAKAELDKILKRVGLGAEAKGEVDSYTIEFSGVFQKDLAKVIENNDNCKLEAFRMLTDYHYKLIKIEAENSKKEPGKPVSIVASWFLTSVKNKEGKKISIDEISSILETKINKNEPFIVFSQTGEVYSQLSASAKGSEDGSAIVRYGKAARPSTDIFYSVESDHIVLNLYNRNSESFETSPRGVKFNLNNNMLTLNYLYPMFSEIQLRRYE